MASVIHALWERGDGGLMILPSSIPMDHGPVESELVRYLDQSWNSVIARDIDGASSVPLAIDSEVPNLGRYSATRRVARTIYMGSAPTCQGKNPGIDDRRIRLGCAQPGEAVATFGDALRRLADRATYLYQDGSRYWFSTQPSVARLADDRAAQQDPHDVDAKLVEWLKRDKARGEFSAVHIVPDGSGDVPDEMEVRLVVLGPDYPHVARADDSSAIKAAEETLNSRGGGQRLYKNMLVFVAPDAKALPNLQQAMRFLMAWTSIVDEHEALNLDPLHRRQAESKKMEFEGTVAARVRETWIWVLVPDQLDPQDRKIEWGASRLQGQDELAVRAGKKLMHDDTLLTRMGPARLKLELDDKHLWAKADHVSTRQLWEWIASYLYLPRLRDSNVLLQAIEGALGYLINENFGYADRYDEEKGRYEGLRLTGGGMVVIDDLSVLVKPDVAEAQIEREREEPLVCMPMPPDPEQWETGREPAPQEARLPRRFHASVEVDPDRLGRDAGRIAEEVVQHLTTLPGSSVRVTLEIEVEAPEGVPEDTQRIVTENCQTLRFKDHGFEDR